MTSLERSRLVLPVLLIGALVVALLATACGGDDDDDTAATQTPGSDFEAVRVGDLTISDAWVREGRNTGMTAAYMLISSSGSADTLVSAASPIAGMVQLHEVITEGSTSKMQEMPGGFAVPANGSVELKPGGFHVMLMDLKQEPKQGETVELTLTFQKAGQVRIVAPVKVASGTSPDMNHGSHGSGGMASPTAGGTMSGR